MEVTSNQIINILYRICVKESVIPEKFKNEITPIESLRKKIDHEVITEFLQYITKEDFKWYLKWHYSIDDTYYGGSISTEDVDLILETYCTSVEWAYSDHGIIADIEE
jgi:hypothetical protein